jgi:hypothetical protein
MKGTRIRPDHFDLVLSEWGYGELLFYVPVGSASTIFGTTSYIFKPVGWELEIVDNDWVTIATVSCQQLPVPDLTGGFLGDKNANRK